MITGTGYGVILNDSRQVAGMAEAFAAPPYKAAPAAPVLYVKPRTCFAADTVPLPAALGEVELAATVGLLFGRDLTRGDARAAAASVAAACLAVDVSEPHADFYRPAIRQRCRDGFLPLGRFAGVPDDLDAIEIVTRIDGREAHRWSLDRLVRPAFALAAELSRFMTLGAGDLLLIGLPGDAPRAGAGATIEVRAAGLPTLRTRLVPEDEA